MRIIFQMAVICGLYYLGVFDGLSPVVMAIVAAFFGLTMAFPVKDEDALTPADEAFIRDYARRVESVSPSYRSKAEIEADNEARRKFIAFGGMPEEQ